MLRYLFKHNYFEKQVFYQIKSKYLFKYFDLVLFKIKSSLNYNC